ncbi:helix-turn-helix transcriptional regulator [Yersinia ruckeri]|uniref:helix-turn-helix transcriptional regulator n=1 Tax=Yersinia ruckeri TaxID=29486 RepID=UPI0008FE1134|nr:helix-turn-helix transcriptional regulator [Yersinia ruckeri]OJB80552.1 AraC family transcriptional regulator [Yersinia ruckeri]OJB89759.1 AraC family transcriptional regulator [Yersinia ruckeri]OJC00380.1 AraC family transcriptional regulator [Yersinia ruckeri]OJC03016.1 AraC family transcriptional regulator [Yersinia ruckeri]OJC05568.1 AraC family transcriptional regulator [Yersinia ruckeri]
MERVINFCSGIGSSALVIQHTELELNSIYIDHPLLIMVNHGHKIVRWENQECIIRPGEIAAINGGQAIDITNVLSADGVYFSHTLSLDPPLLSAFAQSPETHILSTVSGVMPIRAPSGEFINAFSYTFKALTDNNDIPNSIIRHRVEELLLWLALHGGKFLLKKAETLTEKVRHCLATDPHKIWTAAEVAQRMSMSEVVLRRKLSAENTILRNLMIDVRMTSALKMLLSTDWPISLISSQVGYESSSRFAERFRKRFGFAPTAIRGHHRTPPTSLVTDSEYKNDFKPSYS